MKVPYHFFLNIRLFTAFELAYTALAHGQSAIIDAYVHIYDPMLPMAVQKDKTRIREFLKV